MRAPAIGIVTRVASRRPALVVIVASSWAATRPQHMSSLRMAS
jgi:hypothetical protein